MIIDRWLSALRAVGTSKSGPANLAMGQGRPRFGFPTEPFPAGPAAELRDRGITENERRGFVRHRPQIIQRPGSSPTRKRFASGPLPKERRRSNQSDGAECHGILDEIGPALGQLLALKDRLGLSTVPAAEGPDR